MNQLSLSELNELRQHMRNADFGAAELLARSIQRRLTIDSPLAVQANHLLARASFANRKYAESKTFLDLAIEIRKLTKSGVDDELILMGVLEAELLFVEQNYTDASQHLATLILDCEKSGLFHLIHAPVSWQCVCLAKMNRIDEIADLLTKYLPEMRKNPSDDYRDSLRRMWKEVSQNASHIADKTEIIRLILNTDVLICLNVRTEQVPIIPVPNHWGKDPISNFLQLSQNNTLTTFHNSQTQFKFLINLEARFQVTLSKAYEVVVESAINRLGNNIYAPEKINSEDWLELYFLMRAHASFLAAIRLATSGQYAETNMVLRGALEHAMYCFRIADASNLKKPLALKQIWFDKYKDGIDGSAYKAVKHQFGIAAISERMKAISPHVDQDCARLYAKLVDFGGHPNEATFSTLASTQLTSEHMSFSVVALHADNINELIDTCIDTGLLMLEIFAMAMPGCTAAPPNSSVTPQRIAERAYERWSNRGGGHGHDVHDWCRAEAELRCLIETE